MDELTAKQKEADSLANAYMYDADFIERQYQVPSLEDLLAIEGVVGVARLIECRSFSTERLHTFVFSADKVCVTTVRGATSLWYSIPQYGYVNGSPDLSKLESEPFIPGDAERRSTTLPLSLPGMPSELATWEALVAKARAAPSCETSTLDGISYRHRVRAQRVAINVAWRNPGREHPVQAQLLNAYGKLLDVADLFPEEREAAEKARQARVKRKRRTQFRTNPLVWCI